MRGDQLVGYLNRKRHKRCGIVTSEAEHQPLVARATRVNPHRNIRRLGMDKVKDTHFVGGEEHCRIVVADLSNHIAGDLIHFACGQRVFFGGDLTRNNNRISGDEGLTGYTAGRKLSKAEVKNGIADLIGHFIRVPHRNRLRREQGNVRHFSLSLVSVSCLQTQSERKSVSCLRRMHLLGIRTRLRRFAPVAVVSSGRSLHHS